MANKRDGKLLMLVLWICGCVFLMSLVNAPGMYTDRSLEKSFNLGPSQPLETALIPESRCLITLYHGIMNDDYEYQIWIDGELYVDEIIHKKSTSSSSREGTLWVLIRAEDVGLGNISMESTGPLTITFYQTVSKHFRWYYEHFIMAFLIFGLWPIPVNIIKAFVKRKLME